MGGYMITVLNKTFETQLRLLCLLAQTDHPLSLYRILLIDIIACYGEDYHVADRNLHGDCSVRAAELAARRVRIRRALEQTIRDGYLIPEREEVFCYRLTEQGRQYANSLQSTYAISYSAAASRALILYAEYPDTELMNLVCNGDERCLDSI